jgi:hypothetical protein
MSADATTGSVASTADVLAVMALLPHRFPMLLVDRVIDMIPGQSATGIKAVTINEPFFAGHFPAKPIMPGVLIVEALAQTAGVLAIHGARPPHVPGEPVVEPLVQSVNHFQMPGTGDGLKYTRYGNTPNAERLQKRLALLEGAEASLVLSSGMAATAAALLALLRPGDHLLCSRYIYGGTHRLLTEEFGRMGIDVQFVDPWEQRVWRRHVRKETRAIFVESPVNPTCRVLDIRPISIAGPLYSDRRGQAAMPQPEAVPEGEPRSVGEDGESSD